MSDVGLGGAFAANDRGQPMQMFGDNNPFYPLDPRPEDFDIEQIAHALSLICRYSGHCKEFYSVAQHSVVCASNCDQRWAREALMHDASEAYIGDMIRPLKKIMPQFVEIEKKIEAAIAERFGLTYPWPDAVHEIDNIVLATEKRDLVSADADWGPLPEPLPFELFGYYPVVAKTHFLDMAKELRIV